MRPKLTLALVAFVVFCCVQARATLTTYNINVASTGSTIASASYTITFDPSLTYSDTTTGFIVNSFSGFADPAITGFLYQPSVAGGQLVIGGLLNGVASVGGGTNDYFFNILHFRTLATFNAFVVGDPFAESETGTVRVSEIAATPEPSSLALLGTGILGAIGAVRRRYSA